MTTPLHSRAWLEVDLGALRRNGAALRERAGIPLLPVVKADGYGLGAVPVARALEALDPWGFGVATVDEGAELRRGGIDRPILVLSPVLVDELPALRAAGLRPALGHADGVRAWIDSGGGPWHLSIDTGMSRAGIPWHDVATLRGPIAGHPPEGAFTHFHSAERTDGSVAEQDRRFRCALDALPARPRLLHAENSPALERVEGSRWDLARPGVFLYGVGSGDGAKVAPEPVAHLRARVIDLRTIDDGETVSYGATWRAEGRRRIATIGIGYADGYRRALGPHGFALIGGRRARIAGVVTMDMVMLDVTDVPCAIGDVATLVGSDGGELITVSEAASWGGLIGYELLVALKLRVPRVLLDAAPAPQPSR